MIENKAEQQGDYLDSILCHSQQQQRLNCPDPCTATIQKKTVDIRCISMTNLLEIGQTQNNAELRKNSIVILKNSQRKINKKRAKYINNISFKNRETNDNKLIEKKLKRCNYKNRITEMINEVLSNSLIIKQIEPKSKLNCLHNTFCTSIKQKQFSFRSPFGEEHQKINGQLQNKRRNVIKFTCIENSNNQKGSLRRFCNGASLFLNYQSKSKKYVSLQSENKTYRHQYPKINCLNIKPYIKSQKNLFLSTSNRASPENTTKKQLKNTSNKIMEANASRALNCFKIDMIEKNRPKPQTALIVHRKRANILRKNQNSNNDSTSHGRNITGWQDYLDTFQRQIYF